MTLALMSCLLVATIKGGTPMPLRNYKLCEVWILHPQVMRGTFVSNLCLDPRVPRNELHNALGNVVSRCASSLLRSYVHQELI